MTRMSSVDKLDKINLVVSVHGFAGFRVEGCRRSCSEYGRSRSFGTSSGHRHLLLQCLQRISDLETCLEVISVYNNRGPQRNTAPIVGSPYDKDPIRYSQCRRLAICEFAKLLSSPVTDMGSILVIPSCFWHISLQPERPESPLNRPF